MNNKELEKRIEKLENCIIWMLSPHGRLMDRDSRLPMIADYLEFSAEDVQKRINDVGYLLGEKPK